MEWVKAAKGILRLLAFEGQFFATPRFLALTLKEFRLFHYFRWRAGSLEHRQMLRASPRHRN